MILMVLGGLIISALWYLAMTKGRFVTDPTDAGPIGDSFGPLTSLFSSLALGAAVIATYYQVREFRSQLKEMSESKEELEKQTANQVLYQTINHLPIFSISLRRTVGTQALLELSNLGQAVSDFELEADCKILSRTLGNGYYSGGRLIMFGSASERHINTVLELPEGDESKEVALKVSYVLHTGIPSDLSIKIRIGQSLSTNRKDMIENLKHRLWLENNVGFP